MSHQSSLGTPEQLKDPNYTPPLLQAVSLGIRERSKFCVRVNLNIKHAV